MNVACPRCERPVNSGVQGRHGGVAREPIADHVVMDQPLEQHSLVELRRYLRGDISLRELHRWLVPASWEMHRRGDEPEQQIAGVSASRSPNFRPGTRPRKRSGGSSATSRAARRRPDRRDREENRHVVGTKKPPRCGSGGLDGAGNEIRTRDPYLGKVVLYR